ncbi:hypothetical protein RR46_03394 [Papilio xuthus]|uniref:Uncharacterized protein n=1 Tax=Papilio xuthus TaxID=66420 RepID=A0A194Q9N6_PAPXU|nr:hypothetical protein RR46_03394 [Papilio xuthus]
MPFAVETLGPWGSSAQLFKEIAARLIDTLGDPRAGAHFGQRLSLAIQRGNFASLLGKTGAAAIWGRFFTLFSFIFSLV